VQKTTYGTAGALAAREASLVLYASFVVAGATARVLQTRGSSTVTFVVTGEDGQVDEDLACAQYIAHQAAGAATDTAAFLRRAAESRSAARLTADARRGFRGVHADDVALCLDLDRFPFAMAAALEGAADPDGSMLVLRPYLLSEPTS
jgi:2-phosphosulfolactate phosphatase